MTTTAKAAPADPIRAFREAVARSRDRARQRRIAELRSVLADLDRRRRDAFDELVRIARESRGGET